jgi:hypothetical protein
MAASRQKTGGRTKGTPNKATVAKLLDAKVAEKVEALIGKTPEMTSTAMQVMARTPRGKDELAELILVVKGHVAKFQQAVLRMGEPDAETYNWSLHDRYVRLLELFAKVSDSAADFQDPRLKAQLWVAPPADIGPRRDDDRKVVRMGDPVRASRLYQQAMQAPRQKALPPPAKRSA